MVKTGVFGPVLVHVLELERAAARGAKGGEATAVCAPDQAGERADRHVETVGLLLVSTVDALFEERAVPQLLDLGPVSGGTSAGAGARSDRYRCSVAVPQ